MQLTLPTAITLIRILLLPVLIVVFYLPYEWSRPLCAAIFALGGITDWLDGYLARKLNQQSKFGAFLDPVADKLLVAVVLVLLVESEPTPVVALPAIVIIGREIVISALREWMAELGKRRLVAVSMLGKVKTTAQITALLFMLYYEPILQVSTFKVGLLLLYVAAALTIYSMVVYLKAALAAARVEG
jgi:CDP-diacylglycerol--glycerol-3-phosphate 3-phosphatidyltransferase